MYPYIYADIFIYTSVAPVSVGYEIKLKLCITS